MSKLLLNREKRYMEFVEMCSNKAFPEQLSAMLHIRNSKSFFKNLCWSKIIENIDFEKVTRKEFYWYLNMAHKDFFRTINHTL